MEELAPRPRAAPEQPALVQLGDFRIVREIGRGGMGIVYEAVQQSLGRRVALKVLSGGSQLDATQRQRFRHEAQAAARLHHTNIVPVFGVGEQDGIPYYAMQIVEGQGLDRVLAKEQKERASQPTSIGSSPSGTPDLASYWRVARIGLQAAEALAHAHSQGVLHRDVKPSNLLLDEQGTVWMTDFGLAKAEGLEGLTETGDLVGTLRYLAPERFERQADGRSDVYALGLTLYELLTLRPAFDEVERGRLIRQVSQGEPPRPRSIEPHIPLDLETVVLKAIEREPARRYQTAADFADDLRCFLDARPVKARRIGLLERGLRWCRRNPWIAALGTSVFLLLLGVIAASLIGYHNTREALQDARKAEEKERLARQQVQAHYYTAGIHLAQLAQQAGNVYRLQELLEQHRPSGDFGDLRGWEWYYLRGHVPAERVAYRGHTKPVSALAWSPDGKWLASAGDSVVKVWDSLSGHEQSALDGQGGPVERVWWSRDGRRVLFLAARRGREREMSLHVRDRSTGKQLLSRLWKSGLLPAVDLSPDEKWLAEGILIGNRALVRIQSVSGPEDVLDLAGPQRFVRTLSWSADGARLAGADVEGSLLVWEAASGKQVFAVPPEKERDFQAIVWSPDGGRLACAGGFGNLDIRDSRSGQVLRSWKTEDSSESFVSLSWHPDNRRLAVGKNTGETQVLDTVTGQVLLAWPLQPADYRAVAWSPDGRRLAVSSGNGSVTIFEAGSDRTRTVLQGVSRHPLTTFLAWSQEGEKLAAANSNGVKVWDGGRVAGPGDSTVVAFPLALGWNADGTLQFVLHPGGKERPVQVRGSAGEVLWSLPVAPVPLSVALSPDSRWLAWADREDTSLREARTGRPLHRWPFKVPAGSRVNHLLAWSPDGRHFGAVGDDRVVHVCSADTGEEMLALPAETGPLTALAWAPTGDRLAVLGLDRTIPTLRILDVAQGKEVQRLTGFEDGRALAWHPDGKRLASAGREVKVWDVALGKELLTLRSGGGLSSAVAWSASGHQLAADNSDGTVHLWDSTPGYEAGGRDDR
jgi:WD40 repeat protein